MRASGHPASAALPRSAAASPRATLGAQSQPRGDVIVRSSGRVDPSTAPLSLLPQTQGSRHAAPHLQQQKQQQAFWTVAAASTAAACSTSSSSSSAAAASSSMCASSPSSSTSTCAPPLYDRASSCSASSSSGPCCSRAAEAGGAPAAGRRAGRLAAAAAAGATAAAGAGALGAIAGAGAFTPGPGAGPGSGVGAGRHSLAPTRGLDLGRRRVAVAAGAVGGATAAGPSAAAAAAAAHAAAAAAAASKELPAHWVDQMAKAPLGRKRVLQRYYADTVAINDLEPAMKALTNAQLRNKTTEFRQRLAGGTPLQSLRAEAFAVVREASRRVLGMRHYDSQLVGGMVLAEGQVAEMATGEGKTLVATLPGYLAALTGRGVHVVTVNDYLAARDAAWMGKLYRFLGLSCAAVQSDSPASTARAAFECDVTYVTGQELGFSYLKDNTALHPADLTLRDSGFHYAIVDEVDSILIDESRNPMIISGRGSCDMRVVQTVDKAVRKLWEMVRAETAQAMAVESPSGVSEQRQREVEKAVKSRYYIVDEKTRTVSYTETGTFLIFIYLREEGAVFSSPYPDVHCMYEEEVPWGRLAVTAMAAYELYVNGRDYIVRDGEAVIVDPSTGRLRPATRWQGGVHQAVEAKEGLAIQAENLVTATITFQLFFRQYEWLAGMTGTAQPAAAELFELYGIKVVPVPTHKPSRRVDRPPRLFYDKALKMHALAEEVTRAAAQQRPVLIGTTSVQESELVLQYLNHTVKQAAAAAAAAARRRAAAAAAAGGGGAAAGDGAGGGGGVLKPRITLLNAKPELVRLEAQVIAQAGLPGAVTIATNMAGRGTDIILGGNPEGLTKLALMRLVYRRLLKADERETLPAVPLSQLDPYDTDDFSVIANAAYSTPDAPHAGLPRPLHEVLSIAIMMALTTSPGSKAEAEYDASPFGSGSGSRSGGSVSGSLGSQAGDSLMASVMGSVDGGGSSSSTAASGLSYSQTEELLAWVMDRAEVLRRKVRGQLRRTYRSHPGGLETLNYTVCVAPVIAAVLETRERERTSKQVAAAQQRGAAAAAEAAVTAFGRDVPVVGSGSSFTDDEEAAAAMGAVVAAAAGVEGDEGEEPPAQVMALRAALHLWLWFDQECARHREDVRSAGGLLVVGTSLNESPRIELQLRGRAGRQGDPGESKMIVDCLDPLMVVFGMDKVSAILNQMGAQLQTGPDYLEAGVGYLVDYIVRWHESMSKNMRLETQKYDAVMEEYRRNLYTLRRLVLCGGDMQRAQIAYVLTQRYVDELVGRYLDPGQPPRRWLAETVRADSLPGVPPTPPGQAPLMVSPLQAVLHCLRVLVNPPGRTTKTFVDFSQVTEAAAANPTVRKTLELFGVARPSPGQLGDDPTSHLPIYMQTEELEVLTPEQILNLAGYIAGTGPLQWPVPPQREISGNFKLQLQLLTHRRLFGYGADATSSSSSSDSESPASYAVRMQFSRLSGLMQRPPLNGPFAEKVSVLRNYLGEVLIGCYEARRLAARLTFVSTPSLGFTDIEADQQVCAFEQQTMLLWMDALWSCFLEDTSRLRNAVNIRSTNGSNPVSEFRIEANAAFLALLDNYRDAVLDKLLVPDFSIYAPFMDEGTAADTDLIGGEAGGMGAAAGPPTAAPPPPAAVVEAGGDGSSLAALAAAAAAAAEAAAARSPVNRVSRGGGGNGSGNGNGAAAAAAAAVPWSGGKVAAAAGPGSVLAQDQEAEDEAEAGPPQPQEQGARRGNP